MILCARTVFWRGFFLGSLGLLACSDDKHDPSPLDAGLDASVTLDASLLDAAEGSLASDGQASDAAVLKLSATGLYADTKAGLLAQGVQPFEPRGVLWADGADKRRWVYLPPNSQIDSSASDDWLLPIGTKLWKEFTLDGKRLETRMLEKTSAKDWTLVAFQWSDDQTDALAVPDGVPNAAGTAHDIPSTKDCARCHDGVVDQAIGFSAVLLAHAGPGVTLASLVQDGRLTDAPESGLALPGDAVDQAALLYLHANCGNCHNDRTFIADITNVDYRLEHDQLGAVDQTSSYRTIERDLRVSLGSVDNAKVIKRMSFRGPQGQMPPLASKQVDSAGLQTVRAWVTRLNDARDAGVADASAPDAAIRSTP